MQNGAYVFNADRIKSVRQLILVAEDVKQLQAQISESERAGKIIWLAN